MIKRFIAGATCPKCGEIDCIQSYRDEQKQLLIRECVECDYSDALSENVNVPNELQTRVNKEQKPEVETQVIRFDPNSLH